MCQIAALHIDNRSSLVKKEVALLLAVADDGRAWDIFIEVLSKKNSISNWVLMACSRYARTSITHKQLEDFNAVFDSILAKSKNQKVRSEITSAKEICRRINEDL